MKETYLELMELSLSAYSKAHILRFFSDVKQKGLTEHGFPRLTANIGILIAHGRRKDLLPIFLEMMDFCCANMPTVKAANDFTVKEIIFCISSFKVYLSYLMSCLFCFGIKLPSALCSFVFNFLEVSLGLCE